MICCTNFKGQINPSTKLKRFLRITWKKSHFKFFAYILGNLFKNKRTKIRNGRRLHTRNPTNYVKIIWFSFYLQFICIIKEKKNKLFCLFSAVQKHFMLIFIWNKLFLIKLFHHCNLSMLLNINYGFKKCCKKERAEKSWLVLYII